MRWIVKLTNERNELRYWDGDAPTEANAAAKALEANPNWWLVRSWPISDAEYAAIIREPLGPLFGEVDRPLNGGSDDSV